MPRTVARVALAKPPSEQPTAVHNRWHPDIPPVSRVSPGSVFRLECLDASGGQIVNDDSAEDVRAMDLLQLHYLSGPVAVEGAEPGDLLDVEILEIGTLSGSEWGYTCILDASENLGLLLDHFPEARKAVWDLDGVYATSRHIQRVRFAGSPHPGVIGCAPSAGLLADWNVREAAVRARRGQRAHPLPASGPRTEGAVMGAMRGEGAAEAAAEGARTWAPREHGGNMDVKELTTGARVLLPVHVAGANLSVGDLQFSQGDGKVTGIGGIKMAGYVDLRVTVVEDGVQRLGVTTPVMRSSPLRREPKRNWAFTGISVDEEGDQHFLDVHVAYRNACLRAIDFLERYGYGRDQAYVLLGAAPVEGRLSCLLEHPNVCVTLAVPEAMFDDEGWLGSTGEVMPRGVLAAP